MAIGGTEQVIRQLVLNTDKIYYEPSILCLDNHIGELGQDLTSSGYDVKSFNRSVSGLDSKLVSKIHRYIKINSIDILHCHQYTPYTYGLLAALGTKASVIFTEHGRFYPDSFKWKRIVINRLLCLKTSAITSISESTADALVKYENFPRKLIKVIYNGISDLANLDIDRQNLNNELGISNNSPVIGTISRLDPIKNQSMMIRSFKRVLTEFPKAILLIVGDGPSRVTLEEIAKDCGIINQIIFTGFKIKPQDYLHMMDIFLLPSFSEGTSMTLLEAMSFSKPCVVTDVGGNPEIVIDGKTGYVTTNNNETEFTEAIIKLLNKKELSLNFGKSGRRRYESLFTVEKMTLSYQQLYAKVNYVQDRRD